MYTNKQKRQLVKDDYNIIAEVYANDSSAVETYKDYLKRFVKSLAGKRVLDVGCGAGLAYCIFY